jgi:hypothetical protein
MRTLFIGDIHGCRIEFDALLAELGFRQAHDRLLLTGDAFARGPDPAGVWQRLQETGADIVLGNHDDRLLRQFRDLEKGRLIAFKRPDHQFTFDRLRAHADQLLPWLEERPLYIATDRFLLVHAGLNPEKGLAGTTRDEFLAIRLWPPAEDLEGPRWHDFYQPSHPLILFGHDALGGLVVRRRPDSSPCLIGLDTGCVYGGQLTAYILEEDRLVQVPCQQPGGYY